MEDTRPYIWGSTGRVDKDGIVWYACDPYPTWYRWEEKNLILRSEHLATPFEDEE